MTDFTDANEGYQYELDPYFTYRVSNKSIRMGYCTATSTGLTRTVYPKSFYHNIPHHYKMFLKRAVPFIENENPKMLFICKERFGPNTFLWYDFFRNQYEIIQLNQPIMEKVALVKGANRQFRLNEKKDLAYHGLVVGTKEGPTYLVLFYRDQQTQQMKAEVEKMSLTLEEGNKLSCVDFRADTLRSKDIPRIVVGCQNGSVYLYQFATQTSAKLPRLKKTVIDLSIYVEYKNQPIASLSSCIVFNYAAKLIVVIGQNKPLNSDEFSVLDACLKLVWINKNKPIDSGVIYPPLVESTATLAFVASNLFITADEKMYLSVLLSSGTRKAREYTLKIWEVNKIDCELLVDRHIPLHNVESRYLYRIKSQNRRYYLETNYQLLVENILGVPYNKTIDNMYFRDEIVGLNAPRKEKSKEKVSVNRKKRPRQRKKKEKQVEINQPEQQQEHALTLNEGPSTANPSYPQEHYSDSDSESGNTSQNDTADHSNSEYESANLDTSVELDSDLEDSRYSPPAFVSSLSDIANISFPMLEEGAPFFLPPPRDIEAVDSATNAILPEAAHDMFSIETTNNQFTNPLGNITDLNQDMIMAENNEQVIDNAELEDESYDQYDMGGYDIDDSVECEYDLAETEEIAVEVTEYEQASREIMVAEGEDARSKTEEQARHAEEEKTKAEEQARIETEEAEAKRKAEEQARLEAEEANAKRIAEEQTRIEVEEAETKRITEEEERIKAEEQAHIEAEEAEGKRKAEEQARLEEEEAKRKAEEERLKAEKQARIEAEEAEAKRKVEEEERIKAEEEVKRKAEEQARIEAEEAEAKRKAEEEERIKAEEEAKRKAEEQARIEAEEAEAKRKAEEDERLKAEEEACLEEEETKRKAEEQERIKAEEQARIEAEEAEAKRKAEEQARLEEEEAKRKAEEAEAKRIAEEEARIEAEQAHLEEKARREAEEAETERRAKEERLKDEEEERIKAEEQARIEAEKMEATLRAIEQTCREALEADARKRAIEEEEARIKAIEEAIREAEQAEARRLEEELVRVQAEEQARLEAELADVIRIANEEAEKMQIEEQARVQAEEAEAKRKAEEQARLEAEEAETKRIAEEERLKAEEQARLEAEEADAKRIAEEEESIKAEEQARLEAEEAEVKRKAEEQVHIEAEEARRKAEEQAQIEAEEAEAKRKAEEEETRIRVENQSSILDELEINIDSRSDHTLPKHGLVSDSTEEKLIPITNDAKVRSLEAHPQSREIKPRSTNDISSKQPKESGVKPTTASVDSQEKTLGKRNIDPENIYQPKEKKFKQTQSNKAISESKWKNYYNKHEVERMIHKYTPVKTIKEALSKNLKLEEENEIGTLCWDSDKLDLKLFLLDYCIKNKQDQSTYLVSKHILHGIDQGLWQASPDIKKMCQEDYRSVYYKVHPSLRKENVDINPFSNTGKASIRDMKWKSLLGEMYNFITRI